MNNNDILRRIRYTFNYDDFKMIEIFGKAEYQVHRGHVSDWLKKDDDPLFKEMADVDLAAFLNGLINDLRGKREGAQPVPEARLSNNVILRKIKIALNLRDEDMIEFFNLANKKISKHELSAFFRKPEQSQFRNCNDQYLRYFLSGMQQKYRPKENQ